MEYKVDEGIKEACRIARQGYLADLMGVKRQILSLAIHHGLMHGKPYYLSEANTEKMQTAINQAAGELEKVKFSGNPLSEDEAPYSFGETIAEQFKVFRTRFCAPYIMRDSMGWPDSKIKMYLSSKNTPYYGKINPEDVEKINAMVQWAAKDLKNITLRWS